MNKIIIILFVSLFVTNDTKSQIPAANSNIANNSLSKFEGTWIWTDGIDSVKIVLRKENISFSSLDNISADVIVGFHSYKKGTFHGGLLVESSLDYKNTLYNEKHSTIFGGNDSGNDVLDCSLKDISKNKLCDLKLVLNSAQNELTWSLTNSEGVKIAPFDYNFTLPQHLILVKQ